MLKGNECILLDGNTIRPNAAKLALTKLCSYSMWGKLTEKNRRSKTEFISDPQELYMFLVTIGFDVSNLLFARDRVICVSWKYAEEERIPNLRHTNEVVWSFVTEGASLHIYAFLDKFQDRAIYTDTDNVIYIQKDD